MKVYIDEYRDPSGEVVAMDVAVYCDGKRVLIITDVGEHYEMI